MTDILDRQTVFDIAINGIIAQGAFSFAPYGDGRGGIQCLYRGPNNTRCGIGHLIPDAEYLDKIESDGAMEALRDTGVRGRIHPDVTDYFLDGLQHVHDLAAENGSPWRDFRGLVKAFAKENELSLANINLEGIPADEADEAGKDW